MVMNILVIAMILGMGGLWLSRGFYSALINLMAVVLAGAVAFAAWEPLAYKILEGTGDRSFLQGSAWSLALAGPFVLAFGLFRAILDTILRANIKLHPITNYIGGGVCGAIAGFVSAGIAILSVGFLRLDAGLLPTDEADPASGYLNIEYSSNGSMQRSKGLWIPADEMVADFYSALSRTTFLQNQDENLATLYPDLAYVPTTLRYSYGMGKGRNTTRPKDFDVLGRYTVGKGKNLKGNDLLGDKWYLTEQRVTLFNMPDGSDAVPPGSHLEGFIIRFNSSAKELGGDTKVAVGNAQLRLLATNAEGQSTTLFPIAVAAQGEADKPAFQRFRYDGKDVFIASVGGASEAYFGFDFVMPAGFEPKYLYIKGVRHTVGEEKKPKAQEFATARDRDEAISGARLLGGSANEPMDTSSVTVLRNDASTSNTFPITISNSPGQTLNKMVVRMTVDDTNYIVDGDQKFSQDELKVFSIEKNLRIEGFASTSDRVNVQVDVSLNAPTCWLNHAKASLEDTKPPVLVDTNGVRYEPIGFIHDDKSSGLVQIRFTPSQVIRALKDLPTVSRSKPGDTLKLIFQVSRGVKIQYFGVGTHAIVEVKPTMDVTR
jgi:hypothetical protein